MKLPFVDRFLIISMSVLVLAVVAMVYLLAFRGRPVVIVPSTTVTVTATVTATPSATAKASAVRR